MIVAHGGLYGAIAEGAVALAVVGLFARVWLRERRRARAEGGGPAELRE
jgi:hypothetical protein